MKPLSEGISKSIIDYFGCDILSSPVISTGIKQNIIETFTYCYNKHLTKRVISKELEGTNIFNLREQLRSNNKPFPVRLGDLKPKLQEEAVENDTSMHKLCRKIIFEHYYRRENPPESAEAWLHNLVRMVKERKGVTRRKFITSDMQLTIFKI